MLHTSRMSSWIKQTNSAYLLSGTGHPPLRQICSFIRCLSAAVQVHRRRPSPSQTIGPPPSGNLLLRKFNVQDAPIEAQTSAVRKWLMNNEPGPTLERSMRRNGFGPVLDARASV